jgi:type III restriction enzyme
MIELLDFQQEASDSISTRFLEYYNNPIQYGPKTKLHTVPFFQALASITASGKTVILADAVAAIRAGLPIAPVVLWLSKGKVVVDQSFANLSAGGKYHHLLGNFDVRTLAEHDVDDVAQASDGIVYFATVGTFNQKDKEEGTLLVHKADIDTAEQSTWAALRERIDSNSNRRPLIVVYDEAHNLTDQQTDLLLELEPDALIGASATMTLPHRLAAEVQQLRMSGRDDDWLTTSVDARRVADSGLVKNAVFLGGYQAPMEETVDALMSEYKKVVRDAKKFGVPGTPKTIYISNTNVLADGSGRKDNPKRPFDKREAPPILIWRHLTEKHRIPPASIAVYCSLKFDKMYPAPENFVHFRGQDKDYGVFKAGNFQHIIFNLSLQEGWDDPLCYCAYVDKSMESKIRVEQIVGRVLRQPGTQHYSPQRLNTAHFYVRVDKKKVFTEVLKSVGTKLRSEAPQIRVIEETPGKKEAAEIEPRKALTVPKTALESDAAIEPIEKIMQKMNDYRTDDGVNTKSEGSKVTIRRKVGTSISGEPEWEPFEQTAMVRARWLFEREVRRKHPGALGVVDRSSAKLDALIGFGSPAAQHIADIAQQIVEVYLESVTISQRDDDPYVVSEMRVRMDQAQRFKNSLHKAYDDMNPFEASFAAALDRTGCVWCRNVPRVGYGIPLITLGPTKNFYPDFLVWKDNDVYAIDTKGGHLLTEAVARKLLRIEAPSKPSARIKVRLVSEGQWNNAGEREDDEGYTVWGVKDDGTRRVTPVEDLVAVVDRVLKK